jgi:hypothetical protein
VFCIVSEIDESTTMTWEQLRNEVVESDGVRAIEMGTLREIAGYGRLGSNVLQVLSAKLAGIGLCHLPLELPSNQEAHVLLLQYGTPAADVVTALSGGVGEPAERALTELNASRDVARVREAALKAGELLAVLSDRCGKCLGPVSASNS